MRIKLFEEYNLQDRGFAPSPDTLFKEINAEEWNKLINNNENPNAFPKWSWTPHENFTKNEIDKISKCFLPEYQITGITSDIKLFHDISSLSSYPNDIIELTISRKPEGWNNSRQSIFIIDKLPDEWYCFDDKKSRRYYKCDTIEGLFQCIEYIDPLFKWRKRYRSKANKINTKMKIKLFENNTTLYRNIDFEEYEEYLYRRKDIDLSKNEISIIENLINSAPIYNFYNYEIRDAFKEPFTSINITSRKNRIYISEIEDDWFLVYVTTNQGIPLGYYICDQFEGLYQWLKLSL